MLKQKHRIVPTELGGEASRRAPTWGSQSLLTWERGEDTGEGAGLALRPEALLQLAL